VITEAIYGVMTAILAWLVGLLPSWSRPDWMQTLIDAASDGVAGVAQLGHWIAFDHISIALAFVIGTWLIALGIRAGRIVLSMLTGGGGSAA
jgi:hypothetical protein